MHKRTLASSLHQSISLAVNFLNLIELSIPFDTVRFDSLIFSWFPILGHCAYGSETETWCFTQYPKQPRRHRRRHNRQPWSPPPSLRSPRPSLSMVSFSPTSSGQSTTLPPITTTTTTGSETDSPTRSPDRNILPWSMKIIIIIAGWLGNSPSRLGLLTRSLVSVLRLRTITSRSVSSAVRLGRILGRRIGMIRCVTV